MNSGAQGPTNLIGQVMGGYRLVRALGKGATGVVFLGRRADETPPLIERTPDLPIALPGEAAIKVLILPWQLDDAERAEFRKRFQREAQMLSALRHPHILPVIAYGEDEATSLPYMILPYLSGGTLQNRLGGLARPMPLAEVASLLDQIAGAVDDAHRQGVVHRDIKPGNILLDEQGQAFLADFSIARLIVEATSRLTRTGMALGTPVYMAPEALAGQPVSPAVDIYGLGMVVYEMVVGLRANTLNSPPSPRALRPDLPEPAEAAILQALERDPSQRFPTAATFAAAFAQGLRNQWAPGLTRFITPPALPPVFGSPSLGSANTTQTVRQPAPVYQGARSGFRPPVALIAIVSVALLGALALALVFGRGVGQTGAESSFALGHLYTYNTVIGHSNSNVYTNSDVNVTLTSLSLDSAQRRTYIVISFHDYDTSKGADFLFQKRTNVYLLDTSGHRYQASAASPDRLFLNPGQGGSVSFTFPLLPSSETALDFYLNTDLAALDMSCVRVTPASATVGCG